MGCCAAYSLRADAAGAVVLGGSAAAPQTRRTERSKKKMLDEMND
jgi:hypothetical protein